VIELLLALAEKWEHVQFFERKHISACLWAYRMLNQHPHVEISCIQAVAANFRLIMSK